MSNILKYTIGIIVTLLIIYLSLDVQNLDKHRAAKKTFAFNANEYVLKFWNDSLPLCIAGANESENLLEKLNENPKSAFEKYGHKLGISKTFYFMVKGKGTIEKVDAEYIIVRLDNEMKIKIATDFIFGNAVRDGSGKVNINDFLNMTDFNNVSVAINKKVKEKVASRLSNIAVNGKSLEFAGAFEISEENVDLSKVIIIPVSVKLSDGKTD
jgi:predicted lipoprotein